MADNFDNFLGNERDKCERLLKEINTYDSVPPYIELSALECYDRFGKDAGREYYKKICDTKNCYLQLALVYQYLGEREEAKRMFHRISSIAVPRSRYDKLTEETRGNSQALSSVSLREIEKGAQIDLAGEDRAASRQLFEWAAENLFLSDEMRSGMAKHGLYNDLASWHLWRGYAFVALGKFTEALDLIKEVVPLFTRYKKKGGDVWQKLEYNLTKALMPLCEYELDPCEANRKQARKGIENFIESFSNNYEKLEAYLYYYHLKTVFPEVYGKLAPADRTRSVRAETDALAGLRISKSAVKDNQPGFYETHGSVIVFDEESGSLEVFGTNKELEEYVGKVKSIGQYPALSRLFEIYALEEEQDPLPLIEDCERLLSTPGLDESVKAKTVNVLEVARDAEQAGSKVVLYFDPEA